MFKKFFSFAFLSSHGDDSDFKSCYDIILIPWLLIHCKRTSSIPCKWKVFPSNPTVHSCYSFMSFPLSLSLLISLISSSSSLVSGHAVSIVSFLSLGSPSRLLPLSTWSRWETKREEKNGFRPSSADSILVNWTPHPHLSSQTLFTVSLYSLTRIQMQSDKRKERKRLSFNWKMERDRQEKREGREEKEKKIRTKKSPKERRGWGREVSPEEEREKNKKVGR